MAIINNRLAYDILELGHPTLRKLAQPLAVADAATLLQTVAQLQQAMTEKGGVGIAAPQVGLSQRLIIVASQPTPRYPDAPKMQPTPMINPEIVQCAGPIEKGWEGCLSVPGLRGFVPRHARVRVRYTDIQGSEQQQDLEGFVARIVQHELDHLQGILFVDRVESPADLVSESEYQQRIANHGIA